MSNSLGSSLMSMLTPSRVSRPSHPIDVETIAFPIDQASRILSLVPPPTRKGTTEHWASAKAGRMSLRYPIALVRGLLSNLAFSSAELLPTVWQLASGQLPRTDAQIESRKDSTASLFGNMYVRPR